VAAEERMGAGRFAHGGPAPASPALEKGRNGKRTEEAEDQRKAGLAEQKGEPRAQTRNGPRKAQLERARRGACPPSFRAPASSSSGASCESTSCGASCVSQSSAQRSSGAPWSCGPRASLSSVSSCRAWRCPAWRSRASRSFCAGSSCASPWSSVRLRSCSRGAESSYDRYCRTLTRSLARAEAGSDLLAAAWARPSRAPSARTNRCLRLPAWFLPKYRWSVRVMHIEFRFA